LLGERRGDPAAPFSFRLDAAKVAKRLRLLTKVLKRPALPAQKGGPYSLDGLRPNSPRNHAPKPRSFLAALSLAFRRSSAAERAASASASLRSASVFAYRAALVSALACSASLLVRPASSFARFRSASVSASLRWVNASEALAFWASILAFWASAVSRCSSFSVESTSLLAGSLAEDDREAGELAGAGRTAGAEGKEEA